MNVHIDFDLAIAAHVVWLAESKNVAKNIEVLAAPATLPASCG